MKSKHGAMEMSVGTIVTIVLLMTVLVLGIFLVQKIFATGTNAIETVDKEVQAQIEKLFADEGKKLAVYPVSREITLKKGDTPKGFAFSVRNDDVVNVDFTYNVKANSEELSQCGSSFTAERAEGYILGNSGDFSLGPGNTMELARLVKFDIPESAPPCTIIYNLEIKKGTDTYATADVWVTIK